MPNFISIVGEDKLDELGVCLGDVDPHYCVFVVLVAAVHLLEIHPVLVAQDLQPLNDKLEKSFEIVRGRRCDKDAAVSEFDCPSYS